MKVSSRSKFVSLAATDEDAARRHVVTAPHDLRRNHVRACNTDKGKTFSFELIALMFEFMEREF